MGEAQWFEVRRGKGKSWNLLPCSHLSSSLIFNLPNSPIFLAIPRLSEFSTILCYGDSC